MSEFTDFCEKVTGEKLQPWQKEFLDKYEEAYESQGSLYCVPPRGCGKRLIYIKNLMDAMKLHQIYRERSDMNEQGDD